MESTSLNITGEDDVTVESVQPQPGLYFHLIMGVWLPGFFCIFGIVGNTLALIVLSRDRHSVTLYSLKALASTDLILLVCAMLQQVIPLWCNVMNRLDTFCLNQGYIRVYVWPIVCIAQMNSIWLTVLISAERYIAIVFPLRASHMCTIRNIRLAVLITCLASIVFNIPKFFEFYPLAEEDPNYNVTRIIVGANALRSDPIYRYFYNTALYCLIIYALPLTILSRLNLSIVRMIKKAKKNWHRLNRSEKKEMNATILPLMIVLVFTICTTQSLIAFPLDAVFVEFVFWLQIYTAVVNLLVIFNSAVNFILMCVFGRKFRSMLKDLLYCCGQKRRNSHLSPKTSVRFV